MGFDARSKATTYSPLDGDTLKKIAERESTDDFVLTAEDIARFNWGTDDADIINEFLRDALGCYKRAENKGFMISADVSPTTDLLIPKPFKKAGLAVDSTHTIRVKKVPPPPDQFQGCCKVEGVTFEFDSAFIRPSVVGSLAKLEGELKKHPDSKIMIFGHTDKVGSDTYNKALSERRSKSVYAFITNKPDIWEELYKEEHWGIKAVQMILKDMGDPYDPGPVDGRNGLKTRKAVRKFQGDNGLSRDGVAGSKTRSKLFLAYMTGKHDIKVDDSRFMDPKHTGCGEFNPILDTEAAHEPNRRVTFFLFNEARLPVLPCKNGDIAPCRKQVAKPLPRFIKTFHCSFYDSIARNCPCEGGVLSKLLDIVSVDDHFAPEAEKLNIKYSILGLAAKKVKFQITSEKYQGKTLFERPLTDAEKTDGNNKPLEWDGKITVGSKKDRFASPALSPLKVKLVCDAGQKDEAPFKILVHALELKLGDFEKGIFDDAVGTTKGQQQRLRQLSYSHGALNGSAGDAKFKKAVEWFQSEHDTAAPTKGTVGATTETALKNRAPHCIDGGALPAAGGKAKVFVSGAFFYASDANLNPGGNPRFQAEKAFWGDGIKIPVYAKIFLKKKSNAKADCPKAVWGTKVLFDYSDPADDTTLIGKQKDYCDKALDYYKNTTKPKGDNCHKARGGKRGDAITKVFPKNSDTSKFPFKVEVAKKRPASVIATAREEDDDFRGQAGVIFRPARMGGDSYILRAYLHSEKDLDTEAEKTTDPDVEVKTGKMYVWRKVRINQYLHKPNAAVNTISMATVNGETKKAQMEFTGNLAATNITQADWTTKVTAALTSDPDFAKIGRIDYASLNTIDFKSHAAYQAAGGALGAGSYITLCRSKISGWLTRIMSEFAKNQFHGMTVLRVGYGHNAYFTNSGLAPIGEGCYIWWPKSSYDNLHYVVEKYALHEMGHCLYLRHHYTSAASGPVATWPASDNPNDHDADDAACAMSYYQTAWHLCGQCILKLRGWDEAVLSKNDNDNRKV